MEAPTASVSPVAFSVVCPHCESGLTCPSTFSFMLTAQSMAQLLRQSENQSLQKGRVRCPDCGQVFHIPAKVWRV